MGTGSVRVSPPGYDGSQNYNDLYELAMDGFTRIEELARRYQIRANIEIHNGNICCSAGLAYRLVADFDPYCVGVIYDPGNMIFEGMENWQMGLELLGPYLSHVHVKNAAWVEDGVVDGARHWRPAVVPMKEGFVSWPRVFAALENVGYQGWISLEDMAQGDTRTKLKDDLEYLKGLEAKG